MEIKKIEVNGNQYEFVNESRSTRSGFAHDTVLMINGCERGRNTAHYLNRTWESYRYQTVMRGLVYTMINNRIDRLKADYKAENGIKRMTAKHNELLDKVVSNDNFIKEYNEVYNKL